MKHTARHTVLSIFTAFSLCSLPMLCGCEGSGTEQAAQETVQELSGKNLIDKGEKVEQQIRDLSDRDIEKIQQDIRKGTFGQEGADE